MSIRHRNRDSIMHKMNVGYKNIITQTQVAEFLKCCEAFQQKRGGTKKRVVVKPMLFNHFNSRGQLDLIDLQTQADGNYKFIFNYRDNLTKFILLFFDIEMRRLGCPKPSSFFSDFWSSSYAAIGQGKEFCNAVIESLTEMWLELYIVHGKPRNSQSQVWSVESKCRKRDLHVDVGQWKCEMKPGFKICRIYEKLRLSVLTLRDPFMRRCSVDDYK